MKKKGLLIMGSVVLLVILAVAAIFMLKPADDDTSGKVDYEKYEDIRALDFFEGGFMGPSEYLLIEVKHGKVLMRYAMADDGRSVRMDTEDFLSQEDAYTHLFEKEMDPAQWEKFVKDLADCKLESWRRKYVNNHILDGTQWHLYLDFAGGDRLERSGSNKFPRDYRDVTSLIHTLVDE